MIFIDALTYPIRGSGWMMILGGAILSVILHVAQFVPLIGGVVAICGWAYFGTFYLDIVGTTMTGSNDVPGWPDVSLFWDDIAWPFVELAWLVLLSFGPFIVIVIFAGHAISLHVGVVLAAGILGCLYFPMSVIATQAAGGLVAALPHVVLPAIVKALPGYFIVVVALVLVFVLGAFAQGLAARIPVVGWFLTPVVALYGLMFQARLIGLVYVNLRAKLGWD